MKYCNVGKKEDTGTRVRVHNKNTPPPPPKKNRKETVQLLYMKRLIYSKNGQSLDLVSPLKLIMSLMVSKQRKKKEYKDDFFLKTSDSVAMQPV